MYCSIKQHSGSAVFFILDEQCARLVVWFHSAAAGRWCSLRLHRPRCFVHCHGLQRKISKVESERAEMNKQTQR